MTKIRAIDCVSSDLHLSSCDDDGYCNVCGEQSPKHAILSDAFKDAWRPLAQFRDEFLDIDGMDEDDPYYEAAKNLDRAFDAIDSCLRELDEPENFPDEEIT